MKKFNYFVCGFSILTCSVYAQEVDNKALNISGSLVLVSDYVARGLTNNPENSEATLQAFLTFSKSNLYFKYIGSKIDYSFSELQRADQINKNDALSDSQKSELKDRIKSSSANHYEHDLIVGYKTKLDKWNVDFNVATYLYPGGENTTGIEAGFFANRILNTDTRNSINLSAQTFLNDTVYMNQFDTYFTLGYVHPLSKDFNLGLSSAFSYFGNDGKYERGLFLNTTKDFVFRFAAVELSRKISMDHNAFASFKYIFGGENRSGEKQKNMPVFSLSYVF